VETTWSDPVFVALGSFLIMIGCGSLEIVGYEREHMEAEETFDFCKILSL